MFTKRRLNPFFKQNTQDMLDDSDMVQFGGESWKDSPPPTLVFDEDDTSKGEGTQDQPVASGSQGKTNQLLVTGQHTGSRRGSCASLVTHCFDEEKDECCKNLKPRPSLSGASGKRNSIVLELPQPTRGRYVGEKGRKNQNKGFLLSWATDPTHGAQLEAVQGEERTGRGAGQLAHKVAVPVPYLGPLCKR